MPELPEVETMVRGIGPCMTGGRLIAFDECRCACRPIAITPGLQAIRARAIGRQVTAVSRRAKRVVIELDSKEAFVIEPRMTGLMLLADPPDPEHLRLQWTVEKGGRQQSVWFWDRRGLGTVRLLTAAEQATVLGPRFLGPDALAMTTAQWRAGLARSARPIKVLLLDQKCVAGIGNLYASEILHRSGIHPATPACLLKSAGIDSLAHAVREILEEAIRHEGSTLSDGTYRNALNRNGGYQNAHRVYDREGEDCLSCGRAKICRIVQAQRSTFYCPRCQRRRSSRTRT